MNFISLLTRINSLFFLFLLLQITGEVKGDAHFQSISQPLSASFPIPSRIRNQNITDIILKDDGMLILATQNCLCIYNGSQWDYVSTSGIPIIETTKDGLIYVADERGPGLLSLDSSLHYRIYPLLHPDSDTSERPDDIEDLISIANDLYLLSAGRLFLYDRDKFIKFSGCNRVDTIYKVSQRLIVSTPEGFYPIIRHKRGEKYSMEGQQPDFILPHSTGYLIYRKKENSFFITTPSLRIVKTWEYSPASPIISMYADEQNYVFLDRQNHLTITDHNGKILHRLTHSAHITKSSFNRLLRSPGGKLWLVQDKNIIAIDYPSHIIQIPFWRELGEEGIIEDVEFFRNKLYVATNKGLYQKNGGIRKLIPEPVYHLRHSKEGLFALSTQNLYYVGEHFSRKISTVEYSGFQWDKQSSRLVLRENNGFRQFLFSPDNNMTQHFIPVRPDALAFCITDSSLIYIKDRHLIMRSFEEENSSLIQLPDKIHPEEIIQLFSFEGKIHLVTSKRIYRCEKEKINIANDLFVPSLDKNIIHCFNPDDNQLVFIVQDPKSNNEIVHYNASSGRSRKIPLKKISSPHALKVKSMMNGNLILAEGRKIFLFNPQDSDQKFTYFPLITGFIAGQDTLLHGNDYQKARMYIREELNHIPYRNHDILIVLRSTDLMEKNWKTQYQSIEKNDSSWSDWINGNRIYLEALREGDHKLNFRMMNSEGRISEPAQISFSVQPPFYRTWPAFFLYGILIILAGIFIYKTWLLKRHKIGSAAGDPGVLTGENAVVQGDARKKYEFVSTINPATQTLKSKWDKYEMTTVLFSDIQGFTKIAEQMNPEALIDELDKFFFHFDSVVEKYHIEKIKTIGDAYMAAGGIPVKNSTNPIEVVLAAIEMQQFMKQLKSSKEMIWDLRIGIHTGPVIAGTIGQKKRAYDIWGDTVNTASRMESSGMGGKINISGTTYHLVKDYFLCSYRGKLPVKYKGNIDMYFVDGLRPELSINLIGLPNRMFFIKLQLLRLQDLESHAFSKLEEELPKNLYFHNVDYARHVYHHASILAKSENLDPEETLLIRTAALLLHLGYIETYENAFNRSAAIASEILTKFHYSENQSTIVSNLILSAKWPFEPQNLLEKIMADISMEYIGRADYDKLYKFLFLEHNEFKDPIDRRYWKEKQIKTLKEYPFYTAAAKRLREVSIDEQINKIEKDDW